MGSIGDRIKHVRKSLNLNQSDFSSKIGVSQGTLSEIENKKFVPSSDIAISVCRYFNIDGNWLLTGEGGKLRNTEPKTSVEPTIKQPLNANTELLNEPLNAKVEQLSEQVKYLFRFLPGKQEEPQSVPLYEEAVCAGEGFSEVSSAVEEYINFPRTCIKHPKNTYAVRVAGDSMVGAGIHNGDILLVDKQIKWRPSYIAIVSLNNELMCKKIIQEEGKLYLEPANVKHKKIELKNQTNLVLGIIVAILHPTV